MIDWYKRVFGVYKREEAEKLSFDDAIAAHMKWKERLSSAINGTSEELGSLEPAVVRCDDKCVLGKWIYGDAQKYFGKDAEYKTLKEHHAKFHQKAGDIVWHCQSNRKRFAEVILTGDYSKESEEVIGRLKAMQKKYQK